MTALFLGAGFSKWAFNLPLVNQLFDFNISTTCEKEAKKISRLKADWKKWRELNPKDTPEKFIYWCLHKSSHRRSRVIWYVSRRLSDPFMTRIRGSFSAAMFDERVVRENNGIIKVKNFILNLTDYDLKGIVTCNYDTIAECALGTAGFNYGIIGEQLTGRGLNPQFPWQNAHVKVTGNIPIAKLHGSLSWGAETKYTSGKPGRMGKALIVPPAPEKIPPNELSSVWELGAKIINDSKCLIIFGFAFNPYDLALLNFLKKNGRKLERVLLIDPFPNLSKAKDIWPSCEIDTIDPRECFDLKDHRWFSKVSCSL
ncbi:hypothetical protein [Pseudoalteromonas rubra]|uniref:hypothetical protein n=1 Tax=Pseudoalteromonas rubra TaxID=43658 RepID=UPI0005FA439D|nr:hypothetical protein [Pseudoalteromonas rubra]